MKLAALHLARSRYSTTSINKLIFKYAKNLFLMLFEQHPSCHGLAILLIE